MVLWSSRKSRRPGCRSCRGRQRSSPQLRPRLNPNRIGFLQLTPHRLPGQGDRSRTTRERPLGVARRVTPTTPARPDPWFHWLRLPCLRQAPCPCGPLWLYSCFWRWVDSGWRNNGIRTERCPFVRLAAYGWPRGRLVVDWMGACCVGCNAVNVRGRWPHPTDSAVIAVTI